MSAKTAVKDRDVTVLKPGFSPTELERFLKMEVVNGVSTKFPGSAGVVRDLKYMTPAEHEEKFKALVAGYDEKADPGGFYKTALNAKIKTLEAEMAEQEQHKDAIYAFVRQRISQESMDRMYMLLPQETETVENERCAVALLKLADKTHRNESTSMDKVQRAYDAVQLRRNCRQDLYMSVVEFHRLLKNREAASVAEGNTASSEAIMVMDFFQGLNDGYTGFKATLRNAVSFGHRTWPATLDEMYKLACAVVPEHTAPPAPPRGIVSTFAAAAGAAEQAGGHQHPSQGASADGQVSGGHQGGRVKRCWLCKSPDHLSHQCPQQAERVGAK